MQFARCTALGAVGGALDINLPGIAGSLYYRQFSPYTVYDQAWPLPGGATRAPPQPYAAAPQRGGGPLWPAC